MSRGANGLSDDDVAELRREIEAGKRPRVFATASSGLDAGAAGQVVSVGDPAEREFVVVRIGGDELPFAPEDLTRTKAAAVSPRTRKAAQRAAVRKIEPASDRPAGARGERPVGARGDRPAGARGERPVAARTEEPAPVRAERAAKRRAGAAGGRRAQASLTVSVRYAEGRWSVEAARGAKTVVKSAPVRAGQALRLIQELGVPELTQLAADVVEAGRAEAERRAQELRDQLAAAEAELADYRASGSD